MAIVFLTKCNVIIMVGCLVVFEGMKIVLSKILYKGFTDFFEGSTPFKKYSD